jgi:hypothetical protein
MVSLELESVPGRFAVCRFDARDPLPAWIVALPRPWFLACTADEISLVAGEAVIPAGTPAAGAYAAVRVKGTLPFSAIGVLHALTTPLAARGVSLLAISTYDTDYLFIPESSWPAAVEALQAAGHGIETAARP